MDSFFLLPVVIALMLPGNVHMGSFSQSCSSVNGKMICTENSDPSGNMAAANSQAFSGGDNSYMRSQSGAGNQNRYQTSEMQSGNVPPDAFNFGPGGFGGFPGFGGGSFAGAGAGGFPGGAGAGGFAFGGAGGGVPFNPFAFVGMFGRR